MMRLIADLYYLRDQSQSAIADLTGFSVSKVSRLLGQARERGVVQITVQPPQETLADLASRVADALGVPKAFVTPGRHTDLSAASRLCAVAAAPWVADEIPPDGVLGIAGGYTTSALIDALPSTGRPGLVIVPLVGGWDPTTPHLDINALVRRAAERFSCRHLLLHAPGRLDSGEVKNALLRESAIRATTEYWPRLSEGLVGIGGGPADYPDYETVMDRVSGSERQRLIDREVVADLVGYLVTASGELLEDAWNDRTIAAPVADLRRARLIAIAAGQHKVAGIIGACRSKLIHTIVTDELTAMMVLEKLNNARRPRAHARRKASVQVPR